MSAQATLRVMRDELEHELTHGILPYWMDRAIDDAHGGFVGFIGDGDVPDPNAPKGAILNARILWTFSAAYRVLGDERYRVTAERAAAFLRDHVIDPRYGGAYWMVNADGTPRDARKHVYAQAFAIYALSEHFRATADAGSLQRAIDLFTLVERHAHDREHGGYEEAFSREWAPLADVRLSEEDADERKSMNTHLHVLEAYTNLYRAWPDATLKARLEELLNLFLDHVVDVDAGHVVPFFDSDWTPKSRAVSFGHDIETSWLLLEAADVVECDLLRARVKRASIAVAAAVLREANDGRHGGIYYEARPGGAVDTDKEWWPQAEAVVGFVNAWEETGRAEFLAAASDAWAFTRRFVVDAEGGEWRRRVARDGTPRPGHEKAGPWKCCYHNARACLEVMERVTAATGRALSAQGAR